MQPTLTLSTYRYLYSLLDRVTPLASDCGLLCQSACCQRVPSALGIYLFPGEIMLFSGKETWLEWEQHRILDYDFPASWSGYVDFVRCTEPCPRPQRPLQCRFFPLAPHWSPRHGLQLILETLSLPYSCPLISQAIPLQAGFILTVYHVWQRLLCDPLIRDLVIHDSRHRPRKKVHVVFPRTISQGN